MPTDVEGFPPPELTKNWKNEKNCQIVWFFVVIFWHPASWLLSNCQPIVWMVCLCQMWGIHTTGIACAGRIQRKGIGVLQNEDIGHVSDSNYAQQGQAACPCWVTVFLYELECSVEMTMQTFASFFHAFFTFRIIYILEHMLSLCLLLKAEDKGMNGMQRDITILSLMKNTMTVRLTRAVFGITTGIIWDNNRL